MPLTDLRLYIEALRDLGEIQDVDAPVSLDLELGAIIRRCIETGAPAPLFKTLSDRPGGGLFTDKIRRLVSWPLAQLGWANRPTADSPTLLRTGQGKEVAETPH